MKILWLSHLVPYPPKGGVLQRSYNLIREISKTHEIHVIAFNQSSLIKSMFPSLSEGLCEAHSELSKFCKHVEFIPIPSESNKYGKYLLAARSIFSNMPYTINWLDSETMRVAIKSCLDNTKFDLVHFDTISLAPYISLIGQIPKILDHHNIESHMMIRRSQQEGNLLKKLYFYQEGEKLLKYEKRICCNFDLHITCSSLDSDRLKDIDPTLNIDEIPNGVDTDYFSPTLQGSSNNRLVFAGGLSWYPNKDAMLFFAESIWPLLKKKYPNIKMDIIGKGPPKKLIEIAQKDNNLFVHGFVDDVREYIDRATIYVCPIRDGGGTKLKMLDAFSMRKAVVAHPAACEGLDVIDGESVLLAMSANEFSEKIAYLIENPNIRKSMGARARDLVEEKYAYSGIGKKLSHLVSDLIKNAA